MGDVDLYQHCRRPIVYIDEGGFANDTIAPRRFG